MEILTPFLDPYVEYKSYEFKQASRLCNNTNKTQVEDIHQIGNKKWSPS